MRGKTWLAVLVATMVTVTGCSTSLPPDVKSASEAPVRGGRLVFGLTSDISTLQPVLTSDTPSQTVWTLNYRGLLTNDPMTGAPQPGLAERFETSPDGKRITFTLRPGLVWSDGVALTGEDYRYAVEATARSKRSPSKSGFKDVVGWQDYVEGRADTMRGIQVLNSGRTIQVDLARPTCAGLRAVSFPPLPRHRFTPYWDARTTDTATNIDNNPLNMAPPVASGPFVFAEYRPGELVRLVRNDKFYGGAPLVDEVVFRVFGDAKAFRGALITGEVIAADIQPADVDDTRQRLQGAAQDYRIPGGLSYTYLGWNFDAPRAPWLRDKRVRQALAYAVDMDTIAAKIFFGYAHHVWTYTPQTSWAYDDTGLNHYNFDPKRARSLIETAGATMGGDGIYRWTNGRPMEVKVEVGNNTPARVTALQVIQEQYRGVGIKVEMVVEPFPALLQRLDKRDASVEGWLITTSVVDDMSDAYYNWHSSQIKEGNWAGFADPELDAALEAGLYGPDCSLAARRRAYHTMDRILNDAMPFTFLYSQDTAYFRSNKVVGPPPMPYAARYAIETWWLRP